MMWTDVHRAVRVEGVVDGTGGVLVLVAGELDVDTCPSFETWFDSAVPVGQPCRIDVGDVTFCGVDGVRLLASLVNRSGGRVRLINIPSAVRRVFDLTDTPLVEDRNIPTAPAHDVKVRRVAS
jgi:anti-anti-sigma factor